MDNYLINKQPHVLFGGICLLFRFPNGWGASVVRHQASKGGPEGFWELALVSFEDTEKSLQFEIRNDVEWVKDPLGYLFIDEVMDYLEKIKEMPSE